MTEVSSFGAIFREGRPHKAPGRTSPEWDAIADQIEREADYSNVLPDGPLSRTGAAFKTRIEIVCAADVKQTPVNWLWQSRLAIGKLTLLGGQPDMGKSQIATDIEAKITRGMPWPDGGKALGGSAIVLSSEDSAADTIVPRLDLAGADLRRVHIVKSVFDKGKPRTFSLQNDLDRLAAMIEKIGDVALIRIDPVTSYLGDEMDSHRTTSVRAVLEPLADFAERMQIAILAISHPPKAAQSSAINSFTGSLAFVAAARLAFVAVKEPETGRSLLLPVKNNVGSKAAGISYRIQGGTTSAGVSCSHIIWDAVPVTVTADEALHAERDQRRGKAKREAVEFLKDELANGAVSADIIKERADAAGISGATLRRAKDDLGITAEREGFGGGGAWKWRLP